LRTAGIGNRRRFAESLFGFGGHHVRLRLERFSYRFAEQVLNARLAIKQELESVLLDPSIEIATLSRPVFNATLVKLFVARGWESQPPVFDDPGDPAAKMDFLKDRVGVEVGFGHASFIGIDLLKFQVASYSALNKIDMGVVRHHHEGVSAAAPVRARAELGREPILREGVQVPAVLQERDPSADLRDWGRLLRHRPKPPL
jgi:hypothetical protein